MESITFSDRVLMWCADFLGTVCQGPEKVWVRDLKVGGAPLSGVLVQGESLELGAQEATAQRGDWSPVESQGTGKHEGVMNRNRETGM